MKCLKVTFSYGYDEGLFSLLLLLLLFLPVPR